LSHPKHQEKNLEFIIETFIDNDYPLKFIFDTINMRLKSIFKKRTKKQAEEGSNNEKMVGF